MAEFSATSVWEYKCPFRKVWVEVKPDEDQKLKAGYLQCKAEPECSYLVNGVRFMADFSSMVRTNIASKRTMELRLRGCPLPFPPPQPGPGKPAPAAASLEGATEADKTEGPVPLSPEALTYEGKPVPHSIRKAWGQGVQPGVTMSQEFEFTMELADKEYLGEMLTWNMLKAGIPPESLIPSLLYFVNKTGQVVTNNKDAVSQLLGDDKSYPIKVIYKPPFHFKGMGPERLPGYHSHRTLLKFVQTATTNVDQDIMKVKHWHQRRTFERYQLYLEDHYYQCEDKLEDAPKSPWELYQMMPFMTGSLGLIDKSGPGLTKVLTGEADILEYLFGG